MSSIDSKAKSAVLLFSMTVLLTSGSLCCKGRIISWIKNNKVSTWVKNNKVKTTAAATTLLAAAVSWKSPQARRYLAHKTPTSVKRIVAKARGTYKNKGIKPKK